MSLKIDRVQLDIIINNDQARQQLRKLEGDYKSLATEQKKFAKGSEDWERIKQKMLQVKMQMDKVYESIGIANLSLKELRMRQSDLNNVLSAMSPSMKGYSELKAEADAVGARIKELKGNANSTGISIGKIADGFNKYFAVATAGIASLTGLIFSLRKVVDIANLFEERVDNLSALTGLLGDDLAWLSEQAKDLSTSVIEGNIRIKSSATEIVDAYTKVGSKRPELLQVKEDLNAVTQEAMILAEASKSDLQPAVDGLTMVLNQFNAPAEESRRIINVLAAGSKAGAGEVEYLTAAFEKSGSVASSFGVSIEELTGVFETLAPRMTEPEMAGRSLRNIMIKLETQSDDNLKPSIVGLGKAFEYMHDQQWSVTKMTELFGTENINAANILINNTAETKKYTEAVTGTNVALEQAAINTDNNATKLQQAKNKVEVLSIEFGQKLAPAMTFSTNVFAAFMRVMMAAPGFVHEYNIALIALGTALLAYNGAIIKSTAAKVINNLVLKEGIGLKIKDAVALQAMTMKEQLLTIWKGNGTVATKAAATAQYLWNTAVAASPIGAIIAGIGALVIAIKTYDKYNAESVRLEKEKTDAINHLKNANDSMQTAYENQQVVIGQLNKLNAEQKKNLLDQTDATLKAAEAELILATAKQQNIEKDNTRTTLWQKFTNSILSNGNPAVLIAREASDAVMNGMEASKTLDDGIKSIMDSIKQLRGQSSNLNEIVNAEKFADDITGRSITQLEEKQRYLTTALKNYEKGSADYIRISKKLSEVTKQLQSDASAGGGVAKEIADDIQKLNKQISDIDSKINNAIASGNLPLAEKFQKEKAALELLAATYKTVKEEIAKGWDLDQRDQGSIEKLVSVGAKMVTATPDKNGKKAKSILQKRETDTSGPKSADEIVKEQEAAQKLKDDYKDAAFEGAKIAEDAIFEMKANKRQADYDHAMSLLEKERAAELDNAHLTEAQKVAINAKYDKQAAKLKADNFKKQQNADVVRTIINGVMAIGKTFADMGWPAGIPMAAIAAANTIAQVAVIKSQKVPQYFTGRNVDVTGSLDGRKYKNVPYSGNATTGLYTHPTLIADHGSEIVIDHLRSRNIQMNYPEIMEAIRAVPQHYAGRLPDQSTSNIQHSTSNITDPALLALMNENIILLRQLQQEGVQLNYQKLKDMQTKEATAEKLTAM